MAQPRRKIHWSERDGWRTRKLSPRVKLAIKLHATGAVPTKMAAAKAAGLAPSSLYGITSAAGGNDAAQRQYETIDQMLTDRSVDVSVLIESLSVEAIKKMGQLMQYSGKDEVQLRAAMELADRGKKTAKVLKHEIQNEHAITPEAAKNIAEALVQAAEAKRRFAAVAEIGFIGVQEDLPPSGQDDHPS